MSKEKGCTINLGSFYVFPAIVTAIVGNEIHNSIFWSIVDFFFWPIAWIKWLLYQEVNISIIKSAFSFFLQ